MTEGFIVVVALLVFAVITLLKGVRIVPQGEEWIVERLGKYHTTLHPGLNIIIPYLDQVAYKLVTKDIILDVQEQEVITRDNAVIVTNAIAFIKITDPIKAVYGVTDFSEAIRNMIMTTLRSIVGEMQLDEALSNRDKIKARLRESISDEAIDWGLTVKSVEIQDIKPSPSMQKAMEMQASAERERKAMVTRAEGEKQSMILQGKPGWKRPSATPMRRSRWRRRAPRRSSGSPQRSAPKRDRCATCWARSTSPPWARSPSRRTPRPSCCRPTYRRRCAACWERRPEKSQSWRYAT
jgi:regulator of protease activity HflC (stomatin/prohibitin superfamily)